MNNQQTKYYPSILGAIHLIVLYMFIQTIIDFPLALIDYYNGTDYLYNPIKKIILGLGSILFILYFAYRKANVSLKELFPTKPFRIWIIIPLVIFFWAVHILIERINVKLDQILPPPAWFWELFNKIFESDFGIYGAFIKVVITAPIIEELIFRGIIMHGLMRNYSKFTAIFTSALLFALYHLNPWQFPATFVLGLLLGFLMFQTRNIILCILGHAISNGLVLLNMTLWEDIRTMSFYSSNESFQLFISTFIVIITLILIIWLARPTHLKHN